MLLRALASVALVLMLFVSMHAQDPVIFRMDYSASANPLAGWPWTVADAYGSRWARTHVPDGGPTGQDAYELREFAGTGQHGWGWHGHIVPDLPPGGRRFFRWRHKIVSVTYGTSNKLLVANQGCPNGNCRVIIQTNVMQSNGAYKLQYKFQIDGGVFQVETGYVFDINQWHSIQFETKAGTNDTQSDGYLKLWVNRDTYASPTIQNVNIALRSGASESSYVIFGGYNNNEQFPSGASNVQHYTDVEIATAFDPQWAAKATRKSGISAR